jgi:hypothetical protein
MWYIVSIRRTTPPLAFFSSQSGKQSSEVIHFAIIYPVQGIGEPFDRIDMVDFAGPQQRIDDRGTSGSGVITAEQTVIPPRSQKSDALFGAIVVDLLSSVHHIAC